MNSGTVGSGKGDESGNGGRDGQGGQQGPRRSRLRHWVKWAVLATGSVAVLGASALALGSVVGDQKAQRQVRVAVDPLPYVNDTAAVERGRYLYMSRGCTDCHGASGAGREFINDGKGLRVAGPNITTGPGGVVGDYRPVDWVRTIRHGVKPDGRPALIMPSEDYNRLTDADLQALVAYLRQMPPVAGNAAVVELPPPVKVAYAAGLLKDAAEKIDHALPPARPVPEGVTVEHGAYVASMCIGCHGASLAGGRIPGAPPDWPAAANLTGTPDGAMATYRSAQAFAEMMRTGRRPDGSSVSPVMPFGSLKELSEVDMQALHAYLSSLPPVPTP